MRENMDIAEKEHRETLNKMEYKFFKEKVSAESPKNVPSLINMGDNDL